MIFELIYEMKFFILKIMFVNFLDLEKFVRYFKHNEISYTGKLPCLTNLEATFNCGCGRTQCVCDHYVLIKIININVK